MQINISCISNDIPYPVISLQILTFEVEGQEGSTIIDKVTRTVTVPLKETINLKEVVVKQCKVTEGVEAPLDSATVIDLSSPKKYTISLYQDYEWTIQASQTIERKLTIKNQFGKPKINSKTHEITAEVAKTASQKNVYISDIKLGRVVFQIAAESFYCFMVLAEMIIGCTLYAVHLSRIFLVGVSGEIVLRNNFRCVIILFNQIYFRDVIRY